MKNKNVSNLTRSALLLAIVIVFQIVGRNVPAISQSLVGPAVNAILLISTYICGTVWGVMVGALTPILALFVGQLPTPMGPFVPFIMVGNILFVLIFGLLRKNKLRRYSGIVAGSALKYLFLSISASRLIGLFNIGLPQKVMDKLAVMMGTPQLITALIGGAIAAVIIELLMRSKVIE